MCGSTVGNVSLAVGCAGMGGDAETGWGMGCSEGDLPDVPGPVVDPVSLPVDPPDPPVPSEQWRLVPRPTPVRLALPDALPCRDS
ncbi:hypothetical protein GCM10025857_38930 [Alicyclobacillus contaminans]|nr:hypothetical protein GCM10025857_38930 [Alicyclobacillus contaminans]